MSYDALTSVASLKLWLNVTGDGDDAELGFLINVASEMIGRYLDRENLGGVYSYNEPYFGSGGMGLAGRGSRPNWDLVLRHWPIVSLTSVTMAGTVLTILNGTTDLQSNNAGVYVLTDNEPRILKFRWLYRSYPINVAYTAGYTASTIPFGLRQACNQYASEIYKSASWIGYKSKSIQGETVSYDMGGEWGMSDRVQAMLQPFKDVVPFKGW